MLCPHCGQDEPNCSCGAPSEPDLQPDALLEFLHGLNASAGGAPAAAARATSASASDGPGATDGSSTDGFGTVLTVTSSPSSGTSTSATEAVNELVMPPRMAPPAPGTRLAGSLGDGPGHSPAYPPGSSPATSAYATGPSQPVPYPAGPSPYAAGPSPYAAGPSPYPSGGSQPSPYPDSPRTASPYPALPGPGPQYPPEGIYPGPGGFSGPPDYGPPGTFLPAAKSKRSRARAIAGPVALGVVAISVLVAINIKHVVNSNNGKQYFSGGVPSSWQDTTVTGLQSVGTELSAWRLPGPTYGANNTPFVVVVQIDNPSVGDMTAMQWYDTILSNSADSSGQVVTLSDNQQAVTVDQPDIDGQIGHYTLFVKSSGNYYAVQFQSGVGDFASQEPAVAPVFLNFHIHGVGSSVTSLPGASR